MTSRIKTARRRALAALIPPARLSLANWIEAELRLPEDVSAVSGRVQLWPFQTEVADAIGDPNIPRVTMIKATRLGFSTMLVGALGNHVVNEPATVLLLLPTEGDARDTVVSTIEPTFAASPALRGMLTGETDESGRNTLLSRRFPGGSLKVIAAKAARNLRRHTARVLFIDECDAMVPGAEGNPIALAEQRTLSFPDRKIVIGSTPVLEETSNVLRSYAQSDQRVYEVPCPECGAFTEILWFHIKWETDQPETAAFECPHCSARINEKHKHSMVALGAWRATRPEVQGHAGFRLNALVSPLANASWGNLAADFLRAKNDRADLQVFVNTTLAQGWKEDVGEEVDEIEIAKRAQPFSLESIPAAVLFISAGVDVQDDRLEVSIVGWSHSSAYVLAHFRLFGTPDDDATWRELDGLLTTRWRHPGGGVLRVDAALVDSGDGDWTDAVYQYCFPRLSRYVFAGKGMAGNRPAIVVSQSPVKNGRLFLVGVDGLKTTIYDRLARGEKLYFSDTLEPDYFEQVASERKVIRFSRGMPVKRFERKTGAKAEGLDCLVYAFAARAQIPVQWEKRERTMNIGSSASSPSIAPPPPQRSSLMSSFLTKDWSPD
jgi:phage terminase large subunit GpA-like protein